MGEFSLLHWLVVLAIVVLLFGAGKLPRVMGDFAKGIKAFKAGMKEDAASHVETKAEIQSPPPSTAAATSSTAANERPAPDRDRIAS
jgi:sec-independent protein translocase protein TatA